jgi:hypothetical protein
MRNTYGVTRMEKPFGVLIVNLEKKSLHNYADLLKEAGISFHRLGNYRSVEALIDEIERIQKEEEEPRFFPVRRKRN